jgi:hypothetical protein
MGKNKDYILKKADELEALNQASNTALDLVTSTIKNLESINEQRKATIEEIQDYCTNLMQVKQDLETGKTHDEAIIQNFKKLIEVE